MIENLQILENPKKGRCRIEESGEACLRKFDWRGLCSLHHQRINGQGELERFALPRQSRRFNDDDFKVAKRHKKGYCRIVDRKILCQEKVAVRGLCDFHYKFIRSGGRRNDVMEKFAIPSKIAVVHKPNPNAKEGSCRSFDNGTICTRKVFGRGLCHRHWLYYSRRELLEKVGTKARHGNYFKGSPRTD